MVEEVGHPWAVLEYDENIEFIATARSSSPIGYIAIIAAYRFTIYDAYDNAMNGCDFHVVWDNDFRFDKTLSNLGSITCLDFAQACTTCLTGTSNGWILMWDLGQLYLMKKFKIADPRCKTV